MNSDNTSYHKKDYSFLPVKAKLFRYFRTANSAPAVLRLGFHDCLKYKDGTGGCDGCLNWHGLEVISDLNIFLFNLSFVKKK